MTSRKLAASLLAVTVLLGGSAAFIGARALDRERKAEAAFPPAGRLIEAKGLNVHAVVTGEGPDLVLLLGASGSTREFTFALVDRLKDRYRVIALDRPGHGWSDDAGPNGISPLVQADILQAAAAVVGVRRPIVLGQSYGGAVAMAWALRDSETAALVIVSGATMPWPGGIEAIYRINSSMLGGAVVVPLITALAPLSKAETVIAGIFAPEPVPPGYAAHIGPEMSLRRDTLRANARQVAALKPYLLEMALDYGKLALPVEIVHGTADTIVPAATHAEPLSRVLPDARLTLIDGAGHMPHHTHPEAVIAAIDRARLRAGL